MPETPEILVSLDAVEQAQRRLHRRVHRTPLTTNATLARITGLRLHLKAELFQRTGSFKIRGVLNTLLGMEPAALGRGLVSISAGNHAAALAWGASVVGSRATLIMPATALRSKIDATRGYGGEVLLTEGDLLETCEEVRERRGLTFVHPFDDPRIIAGHGGVGLEIAEELPDVEAVVVPVGGGGLISGVAAAVKRRCPRARVFGVEPEGADVMARSLARGEPVHASRLETIADGLAAPFVGRHNLAHVRSLVDEMVVVGDGEIRRALLLLLTRTKLVVEPSAAAGVAALVAGRIRLPAGTRVAVVLSGGNVDRDALAALL